MASAVLVSGSNRRVHYTSGSLHYDAVTPKPPFGHKHYIELHNKITSHRYKNSILWPGPPGFIGIVTFHPIGTVSHSVGSQMARVCSWWLTSILCQGLRMHRTMPPFTHHLLWYCAQLSICKKESTLYILILWIHKQHCPGCVMENSHVISSV